ncbi:MAG: DNA translocase FtsK 4TM domain-containing protein [Pseudomonadota bacterium]
MQENKNVLSPAGEKVVRGLREVALLGFATVALFLLLALLTFDIEDAGWSHSGSNQAVRNAGGVVGAWISDFLLYVFGVLAYLLPLMIGYHGLLLFKGIRQELGHWLLALRWMGFTATLVSGAALAYLHFFRMKITLPNSTGGILGQETSDALTSMFGVSGATLLLLAAFFAGVTLFSGVSWVALIDALGKLGLSIGFFLYAQGCRLYEAISGKRKRKPVVTGSAAAQTNSLYTKQNKMTREDPVISSVEISKRAERGKRRENLASLKRTKGGLPLLALLDAKHIEVQGYSKAALEDMSRQVEVILRDFGVEVEVVAVHPGPVITRFEVQPAAGVKVSRISGLSKDLARALSVHSVRIVEVIPGKSVIGLEIPNESREMVTLREVISSRDYQNSESPLTLVLGKDIAGRPVVANLEKMPHLLVAGTTGSGKSVAVNAMILSMLFKSTTEQVRMIMIDPKMLELSVYEGIPHLLTPVVTDMKEAANALRWCVIEMERRYKLMSMLGVRNLATYNRRIEEAEKRGEPIKDPLFKLDRPLEEGEEFPTLGRLPSIVIIIDELADMMMIVGKKVEELIARLAQKARAAGLHLILATQRPSVDVLTGLIKANVPTRLSFQVSSKIDSRTILDQGGAETLLGNGDMLYLPAGTSIPLRAHGAFVSDSEVHRVVEFFKQTGPAEYLDEITLESGEGSETAAFGGGEEADSLYDEAVRIVTETRKASISSVQRRLKVGYNRAARMIEDMERAGVVSAPESNGSREVLAPPPPED